MKFMKLGSKPDAFQTDANSIRLKSELQIHQHSDASMYIRYVASELATDIVVHVGEVEFYLHKFPLLSKSNYLQKLVRNSEEVHMVDFPGGPKAFEICAKFCYGMTVTLNPYNVVAARCAAEYLEMTEEVDHGNLIFKIEVFLNSSIFRSWKDSIIVLQTTKSLLPWSENLKLVRRCIDSIALRTFVDPSKVTWSYTYSRKSAAGNGDQITESIARLQQRIPSVPKDWWVEDICELDVDLYKRLMFAIKAKGRMSGDVIGEALQAYANRWLPTSVDSLVSDDHIRLNKALVETLIWLLPSNKDVGCSCSFLLKLLKAAILVDAGELAKEDLMKRTSLQLDEASLNDLLIPATSKNTGIYDFGLVQNLVCQFVLHHTQESDYIEKDNGTVEYVLGNGSWLKIGILVDGYLAEIARDPDLPLSSFIDLSESIPQSARPIHDGLYRAIDIYLKEHPSLTKNDKRKICGLMDVKKLTMEASMHAAQNERLPLRVVVQVLYFEQVRAAAAGLNAPQSISGHSSCSTTVTEDWEKAAPQDHKLDKQMKSLKVSDEDSRKNGKKKNKKSSKSKLLPSRSRKIFNKLWGGSKGHGENKSSETSGSTESPTSMNPGENKSSGSSSRNRRHSIS